jgi:hypothetical protein
MFKGALTAMVSPFKGGKLDEGRLREQIEFQIAGGIDGLVPVGTTGESPTLDFREHERVIEITVETARGPRARHRRRRWQRRPAKRSSCINMQKTSAPMPVSPSIRITTSPRRKVCTSTS